MNRGTKIALGLTTVVGALLFASRRPAAAEPPPLITPPPAQGGMTPTQSTAPGPAATPVTPAEAEATTRAAVRTQPEATVRAGYLDYAAVMRAAGREPESLSEFYRQEKNAMPTSAQLLETVRDAIRTRRADPVVRDVYIDYVIAANASGSPRYELAALFAEQGLTVPFPT